MRKYVNSGKFNILPVVLWSIIGLVFGAVIAVIYTAIANWNPFIYLNLLVLMGVIFALSKTVIFIVKKSKSRNLAVNLTVTFLICLFSWYMGWAALMSYIFEIQISWWLLHPGELFESMNFYANNVGMTLNGSRVSSGVLKIFYGVEFLAFFYPMILVAQEKLYYCEFCEQFMKPKNYFFPEVELVAEHLEEIKVGNLSFMNNVENLEESPNTDVEAQYKLNLHTCSACQEKVFNFYHLQMKEKKGKYEVKNTTPLVSAIYVARQENE